MQAQAFPEGRLIKSKVVGLEVCGCAFWNILVIGCALKIDVFSACDELIKFHRRIIAQ
ncbi:hypothetical protein CLOSTMETH_03128 [[Clostridium] methylpentosum DSM 5476]|uniref:Uncharacterized protein n=1 Tax=[Clostridium] methylpentosum DSM 5476 TaxID=537013 RepID=C0EGY4_9FIRM|nr:hypothetical protein CLOSTMETH_03128 [[Clostridium] methylpentosum DSM 5476]